MVRAAFAVVVIVPKVAAPAMPDGVLKLASFRTLNASARICNFYRSQNRKSAARVLKFIWEHLQNSILEPAATSRRSKFASSIYD